MRRRARHERTRRGADEVTLTPRFVGNDAHGIREIQAAVRRTHRNVQATCRRELGEERLAESGCLAAERDDITLPVVDVVEA